MVSCQTEGAAPESGGGDPRAKEWDWNSPYWRKLGAPWGGTHASAPDVATFLGEFLGTRGRVVKPETARQMVENHNPEGLTPRGLGFAVGKGSGSAGCSERTFGHTGSTGTLCWADPATETAPPDRAAPPATTAEAAEAVRPRARHRAPVIACGAGTSVGGHVLAVGGGAAADLSRVSRVPAASGEDLAATAEAGVT